MKTEINGTTIKTENLADDWTMALMRKGIIVKLELSKWSGTTTIKPEDIGLNFSGESKEFAKRYLRLGSEKLLPPEVTKELSHIESKAKKNLRNHSFYTVWGYFVPYHCFNHWEEENTKIREEYFEYAKGFGRKYNLIVDVVRQDYKKLGQNVWENLYPDGGEATESFLTDFAEKIVQRIPPVTDIVSKFKYNVTYYALPVPSVIQGDISKAKALEREDMVKDEMASIEIQAKEKIAKHFVDQKNQIIDGFLDSTVKSMRHQIENICLSVLDSLGKQATNDVTSGQRKKLLEMIEKFRMLNFYEDKEIDTLLSDLEKEVVKVKGEREKNTIISTLQGIVEKTKEEIEPENFNPSISYLDI